MERLAALHKIRAKGVGCGMARAVGYTCAEAKAVGYPLLEAKAAGWSSDELRTAGCRGSHAPSPPYGGGRALPSHTFPADARPSRRSRRMPGRSPEYRMLRVARTTAFGKWVASYPRLPAEKVLFVRASCILFRSGIATPKCWASQAPSTANRAMLSSTLP